MLTIREGELDLAVSLSLRIPEFSNPYSNREYHRRLKNRTALILTAYIDGIPAGFKIGYGLDARCFYSWMGGVLPGHRRQNLAREMIHYQERWCIDNGFTVIRVKTRKKHRAMIACLEQLGYVEIERKEQLEPGETRIVYSRILKEER